MSVEEKSALGSSPRWHQELREDVSSVLGQAGSLDLGDMTNLGEKILAHFRNTIFSSESSTDPLGAGVHFGEYRLSGSGGTRVHEFSKLKQEANKRYTSAFEDLDKKIKDVIGS